MNKKQVLQLKLDLLEDILYDFKNTYTWKFEKKLKRSIEKLRRE